MSIEAALCVLCWWGHRRSHVRDCGIRRSSSNALKKSMQHQISNVHASKFVSCCAQLRDCKQARACFRMVLSRSKKRHQPSKNNKKKLDRAITIYEIRRRNVCIYFIYIINEIQELFQGKVMMLFGISRMTYAAHLISSHLISYHP